MAAQPVGQCLCIRCLGIGVIGGAQYTDKDLCRAYLSGACVNDRHGGASVINKRFFTRFVGLPHGATFADYTSDGNGHSTGSNCSCGWGIARHILPTENAWSCLAFEYLMNIYPAGMFGFRLYPN